MVLISVLRTASFRSRSPDSVNSVAHIILLQLVVFDLRFEYIDWSRVYSEAAQSAALVPVKKHTSEGVHRDHICY
jgi:hypothetical protein